METLSDLKVEGVIGKGTFGKVKRAIHRPTGKSVAVKILQKSRIKSKEDAQRVRQEMKALRQVNHPNILKLLQISESSTCYYLVTELVQGQELFQKINRLGCLDQDTAGVYFTQLLDAVISMHKLGICHRDIKPQNIIISGSKLTLIDMGLSQYYSPGQKLTTSCGSPCYAAPQMMTDHSYDPEKTEVWALGITLYAMLTGRLPFHHSNTTKLYKLMATNRYEPVHGISSALQQLLRSMIQVKSGQRFTLQQVRQHVWVRSQGHDFTETSRQQTFDEKSLRKTSEKYDKGMEKTVEAIKKYEKERAFYFLTKNCDTSEQYPLHSGLVHLRFVFPDPDKANEALQAVDRKGEVRRLNSRLYYAYLEP